VITAQFDNWAPRPPDMAIEWDPPLYQNVWEFEQLLTLYRRRKPRRVLEIGTFHGGSLKCWIDGTAPGATIVSIDLPVPGASDRQRWGEWAELAQQHVYAYQGASQSPEMIAAAQRHGPYDWIFIDADHSYLAVRNDWDEYGALIVPNGVIALHDINPREGYGVSMLWREIQQQGWVTQEINAGVAGLCGIGVIYA